MDNTTPLNAKDYDAEIEKTVPFYTEFYRQVIDLVKSLHFKNGRWLDTGCGTGTFILHALADFPNFQFILCDPSEAMIIQAKNKLHSHRQVTGFCVCGSQELCNKNEFEIITAIQSHHYMHYPDRVRATECCYNALKDGGALIYFENFAPNNGCGKAIAMDRWGRYQKTHGKSDSEVREHQQRYGKNYFPITIDEHFKLLSKVGYKALEIFWLSYMQVGVYAIK